MGEGDGVCDVVCERVRKVVARCGGSEAKSTGLDGALLGNPKARTMHGQ